MYSLNKVHIIGNATAHPEVKQINNGATVCNVGVATNRSWIDKNTGEKQEEAEFHNIVCWGKLAEIVGQYLKKGQKVYFEGRLKTRSWDDAESGKKMYRTEVMAENMIILSPKDEQAAQPSAPQPTAQPSNNYQHPSAAVAPGEQISVEDLPF